MAEQRDNTVPGRNGGTLTPFAPGQSGNPKGRPPNRPIAAELRKLLEKDDGKALRALAAVALKSALKGDYRWGRELLDRIDGKVLDTLDVTSGGESLSKPGLADLTEETKKAVLDELGGPKDE